MSKTGEQSKVPPPPLDEDGNLIMDEDGTNTKTSMAPTLEELMRRLEELTAENKKLRAKAKNKKKRETLPQVKKKTPHLKRMFPKRKRKEEETAISLLSMSFNYNNMSSSTPYTSIPIDKAPYFDGTSYNQ
jgi:hypothetical protein